MHAPTWTASPVVMGSKEKRRIKKELNGKHFIKSDLQNHIYKIYSLESI